MAREFLGGQSPRQGAGRRAVTRADVAQLAGVSTAVVSYVLNEGPRPVAPDTAQRVREAVALLGYRPNASARALRRGRTETIGLILGDSLNPFFTEYTSELTKAAALRGEALLVRDSRQDETLEARIVEQLIERQVDGLLFASPYASAVRVHSLQAAGIPSVLIDSPGPVPGRLSLGPAAREGTEELVDHLVAHGRQRIALVIGDRGFGHPDPRELGWQFAQQRAHLEPGPVVRVPFSREGGYAAGRQLARASERIDAVFASNDLQAAGVLRALHEAGLGIPDQVAVVSFDGTRESEFCWPPLTVAHQDLPRMAEIAIDLLHSPIDSSGHHVRVPTTLITRASCGCGQVGP